MNTSGLLQSKSSLLGFTLTGIMNTSGLLQSKWSLLGFTLTLQETWSIHDSMTLPKIEFIVYLILVLLPNI